MHLRLVGVHEAVELVGVVVVFGFLAVGGRWALVQAHGETSKVVAGMRLALGAFLAGVAGAGLNGVLYYSETSCGAGPPGVRLPALCTLLTVSTLLFLAAGLMFLVSLGVWHPWRGPFRLQLVRATLGLGWCVTLFLAFVATGFVTTGFGFVT
jgi:hypothetical protein